MDSKFQKNFCLRHKDASIDIIVKKNKLSRNYKFTFDKKNLRGLVSIPKYVSFGEGLAFAKENADWIHKQVSSFSPLIFIENNTNIIFEGRAKKIIFEDNVTTDVSIEKKNIIIKAKVGKHKIILRDWMKKRTLSILENVIESYSKTLQVHVKKIRLSNSYNYWGYCNTAGVISINWRLIFAPLEVMRYIVAHELSHLIEFNHSDKFWHQVESLCPDYKNQIKWLKKNDNYLYRVRFN
tara:strand:- start:45 stop:758 length:714 start_codon:yes stop_codon:yes gene_type:complete